MRDTTTIVEEIELEVYKPARVKKILVNTYYNEEETYIETTIIDWTEIEPDRKPIIRSKVKAPTVTILR